MEKEPLSNLKTSDVPQPRTSFEEAKTKRDEGATEFIYEIRTRLEPLIEGIQNSDLVNSVTKEGDSWTPVYNPDHEKILLQKFDQIVGNLRKSFIEQISREEQFQATQKARKMIEYEDKEDWQK